MPRLYVYGDASSADVRIGRAIAAGEGAPIDWLDKEAWRVLPPDAFPEQVEANFHAYDGLPNYGELFENGANAHADRRFVARPGLTRDSAVANRTLLGLDRHCFLRFPTWR